MGKEVLVLASASPRRAELLHAAGIPFDVVPADVDESIVAGETAEAYVRRVSEAKAAAVASVAGGRPVLAADTVVVVDDQILGKPVSGADARRMLRLLSGRSHMVLTGVTLRRSGTRDPGLGIRDSGPEVRDSGLGIRGSGPGTRDAGTGDRGSGIGDQGLTRIAGTRVEFVRLSEAEIEWYVASGEPMDKAGAYAVQGLASRFVSRIEGSYSNVVGLPVAVVWALLQELDQCDSGRS